MGWKFSLMHLGNRVHWETYRRSAMNHYQAISKFSGRVYASGSTAAEVNGACKAMGVPRSEYTLKGSK